MSTHEGGDSHRQPADAATSLPKKRYVRPAVRSLGRVEDMTAASNTGSKTDAYYSPSTNAG